MSEYCAMTADESGSGAMGAHADGRDAAREDVRQFVRQRLVSSAPPVSREQLAKKAGINRDTVSDFLNGKSWPQPVRLDAIERALDLPPGTFDRVLRGEPPMPPEIPRTAQTGAEDDQMSEMVVRFTKEALSDLSPTERDEVEAAAKAAALRRIREIRGQ